jgi:deoxyadenosine/deoxycytidine kinase
MNKRTLISLEGNIGAGKSTLLEHLEKHFASNEEYVFLREPVHLWEHIRDKDGNTMLSKFYSDPVKYAFSFQIMAYTTRLHELKRIVRENPKCKVIICERSLEADKHIFAKMLHDDGLIESVNYQIYESYFAEYEDKFRIDGLVYVKADPETCLERVQKRNRKGETIELDYLKKCHDYHESWFGNTPIQHKTLDVNANLCFDKLDETSLMHVWVNEVKTFVESLKQKNVFSNFGKEVNVYS